MESSRDAVWTIDDIWTMLTETEQGMWNDRKALYLSLSKTKVFTIKGTKRVDWRQRQIQPTHTQLQKQR